MVRLRKNDGTMTFREKRQIIIRIVSGGIKDGAGLTTKNETKFWVVFTVSSTCW